MARTSFVKLHNYPCTCDTQSYDLARTTDDDKKVVADFLRHVAEEIEGGLVKQISVHVARKK